MSRRIRSSKARFDGRRPKPSVDRASTLRTRARRHARRGEYRKAAIALRQVVALTNEARSWVTLGHVLSQAHKPGEAVVALRQGLWLHRRAGADGRARTVARLILDLCPQDAQAVRLIA